VECSSVSAPEMTADVISGPCPASTNAASRPLRLAILEADKPQPQTDEEYNGYGGVFAALLMAAAQALDPPQRVSDVLTITAHDIVGDTSSYPPLDSVDAVLITGSRHTAFDNDPWILKLVDYAKRAIDSDCVRVLGVCFGHQIIGRAMGARLGKNEKGWEVAVTDVELTDKGKTIFQLDQMRVHQMHRDVVFDFPEDSIPLGGNAICPVQAMYSPGRYITIQGHPEFTERIVSEILIKRHDAGILSDDVYTNAMTRAPILHDGIAIGIAFLHFIINGW